jgi:hypothetical protein
MEIVIRAGLGKEMTMLFDAAFDLARCPKSVLGRLLYLFMAPSSQKMTETRQRLWDTQTMEAHELTLDGHTWKVLSWHNTGYSEREGDKFDRLGEQARLLKQWRGCSVFELIVYGTGENPPDMLETIFRRFPGRDLPPVLQGLDAASWLDIAVDKGHCDGATVLLQHGADPNAAAKSGRTPTIVKVCKFIIEVGPCEDYYRSPMTEEMRKGYEEDQRHYEDESRPKIDLLRLLIEKGADVHTKDHARFCTGGGEEQRQSAQEMIIDIREWNRVAKGTFKIETRKNEERKIEARKGNVSPPVQEDSR